MKDYPEIKNKYYSQIIEISNWLNNICVKNQFTKVLELGPGPPQLSFASSTHFIDNYNTTRPNTININIDESKIDFPDGYFDMGYARHIFEDINNPVFAFHEMTRVCKTGYIETPSPLIETTRYVDADVLIKSKYRGYIHHRYFVYTDHEGILNFVPKYPFIEYLEFDEQNLVTLGQQSPLFWNNYFYWDETNKPKCKMHSFYGDDFNQYQQVINNAIVCSYNSSIKFFDQYIRDKSNLQNNFKN